MKFIVKLILIAGLCYPLQLILPFWIVAVVALIINLTIRTSGWSSFFSGFLSVAILWYVVAAGIDSRTGSILTEKVAQLFSVPGYALLFITAFIGGLVAGFGGLTGKALADLRTKSRSGSKYYS